MRMMRGRMLGIGFCVTTHGRPSHVSISREKEERSETEIPENSLRDMILSQLCFTLSLYFLSILISPSSQLMIMNISLILVLMVWMVWWSFRSEWSPCTASCGAGIKARTRLYINPNSYGVCDTELMQKTPCVADRTDCTGNEAAEAKGLYFQLFPPLIIHILQHEHQG